MSVLVDKDLLAAIKAGDIKIEPFDRASVGTNSYDVHLGGTLRTYEPLFDYESSKEHPLDCRQRRDTRDHRIPARGFVLEPGELYLASTVEYTESHSRVPILNGKSSLGRLGLSIHVTAGTGDVGFCGHWTMELFVIKALRVYAGMPIGQLLWFAASDRPTVPYFAKPGAKYNNRDPLPTPSDMAKNFDKP